MNTVDRDIAGALAAQVALVDEFGALTDSHVRQPSRLPEWTLGHVLTHLARGADSHVRMLEAANRGEVAAQYPGGAAGRNAEIEAGATRSAFDLVADVVTSAATLQRCWAAMTTRGWEGEGESFSGPVQVSDLPFRRWRETVVHHADLGLGYSWNDWPADYVRIELGRMTMLWASRRPMGLTELPDDALAVPERHRLAWLLGRVTIDGLGEASIF